MVGDGVIIPLSLSLEEPRGAEEIKFRKRTRMAKLTLFGRRLLIYTGARERAP